MQLPEEAQKAFPANSDECLFVENVWGDIHAYYGTELLAVWNGLDWSGPITENRRLYNANVK